MLQLSSAELHLQGMVTDIDGCIPATSCQALPDVDVVLSLCVPGVVFRRTRKKSVLSQCLWNNKLKWSYRSHRLSRDKNKATRGLRADALVGSQLVHDKVPVFHTKKTHLPGKTGAGFSREEDGQEVLNANCGIFCSLLYEFLKLSYN